MKGLCGNGVSTLCVNCGEVSCINYYDVEKDQFPNVEKQKDYSQFNKGNDCDFCENQYWWGLDGDKTGCRKYDEGKECEYVDGM